MFENLSKKFRFIDNFNKPERIFIIPTSFGLYFIAVVFLLFIISLTFGNSLAFASSFFFISCVMLSAIYTNYNLKGLKVVETRLDDSPTAETNVSLQVRFLNESNKTICEVEDKNDSISVSSIDTKTTEWGVVDLGSFDRGLHKIEKIRVSTIYPFSLFRAWSYFKLDYYLAVGPKPIDYGLKLDMMETGRGNENQILGTLPGTEEFEGPKNYHKGDSWKQINWREYSRSGELFVNQFVTSVPFEFKINLDTMKLNGVEQKLSQIEFWRQKMPSNSQVKVINGGKERLFNMRDLHYWLACYGVKT